MRKIGTTRESTQRAVREAAVALFSQYGYHGVTLRALADSIGMKAGSLYNHIENKQSMLFDLLRDIMEDLVASYRDKVAPVKDPLERLDAFVFNHIEFHTSRKEEVFIGNMELRNLQPENFRALVALRDEYQKGLVSILTEGSERGLFQTRSPRMAAFSILAMLNGVPHWFSPRGAMSSDEIAEMHRSLIHGMLRVKLRSPRPAEPSPRRERSYDPFSSPSGR